MMTRHNTVTNGPWARHSMNRTLTHEVGHWLGFSCVRDGFSSCDDGVRDSIPDMPLQPSGSDG
ncbi:hypothetical protein CPC08DRAFT_773706 [Agrocybe pediades]|nr:hypothetical protein CPC08DRAFT_773706 [Agrocybe pediades]